MNISLKERFLDICHFKRRGDLFQTDGPGGQTVENWVKQGAPKEIIDNDFCMNYFQLQPHHHWLWAGRMNSGRQVKVGGKLVPPNVDLGHGMTLSTCARSPIVPLYEPRIISEDERTVTLINVVGQTQKYMKESLKTGWGMPMYLDWPVKDRATWNELKKRLDLNTPERWPSDWNAYVQEVNGISAPISLTVGGFFGPLREWVGNQRLLYMFYDDPGLIEDMMDELLYLGTEVIKRTLKDIKIQRPSYGEDMAYKAGSFISPAMWRKFMMPRYKKINDLLHSYGYDVIFVDSDGNLNELIPLMLETGVNYTAPLEVAAHNDAVALRKKYGKDLIIGGNIDKRALVKGKEAIREEVMSKVPFLLETGGYFPSVDHGVPTDVTFENFCYYINLMREVAGLEKLSF